VKKSRKNTNLSKIGSGLKSRHLSNGDKGTAGGTEFFN
jgi:hypothetical protein